MKTFRNILTIFWIKEGLNNSNNDLVSQQPRPQQQVVIEKTDAALSLRYYEAMTCQRSTTGSHQLPLLRVPLKEHQLPTRVLWFKYGVDCLLGCFYTWYGMKILFVIYPQNFTRFKPSLKYRHQCTVIVKYCKIQPNLPMLTCNVYCVSILQFVSLNQL